MNPFSRVMALLLAVIGFAAVAAHAQQEVIFSDVGGNSNTGIIVGASLGSPGSFSTVGYNFTVPAGPDVQFDDGELLAGLDSGTPASDMNLSLYSAMPASPASTPIDTMTVSGLSDTVSLVPFTSTSNPILSAGQQYWLVASMDNSSTTAFWDAPSVADPGQLIASINNGPFKAPISSNRPSFALTGTAVQWQTHFTGSANIGGTGMQNAVMVFESFNSSGGVLNQFVQPLGNFSADQSADYAFTQSLAVNGASAAYTILGTYGSDSGTHGVVLGTTQSFGNSAVANGSTFSDIFNGASEETLYSELSSDDYTDVQTFFDQQLADDGGLSGGSGLPDIVLNGQDYQNMLLAESGSLATGGACFAPPTDYVGLGDLSGGEGLPDIMLNDQGNQAATTTAATQDGSGALTLSTAVPEPACALLLTVVGPGLLLRRRNRNVRLAL